uniref:Uncharacterized protein n=1 Tax=Nelumbo nucifera TaxID=4432 RepID=A0A822ZPQ5_NELNU|nr:TPA_asm: hypothetical protein HUJ06_003741 [Nelumbo nucifera]
MKIFQKFKTSKTDDSSVLLHNSVKIWLKDHIMSHYLNQLPSYMVFGQEFYSN